MNIAVISFTQNGRLLARRIAGYLENGNHNVSIDMKCASSKDSIKYTLSEWTDRQFQKKDALIFVGAVGIAVRAIAPYVRSKVTDPAVLVIDEKGNYCIPLLSGHIGGANELAAYICKGIQAIPVITTATDLNQKWAVDVFASKNGLHIQNMQRAKEISARILEGEKIGIEFQNPESTPDMEGRLPEGIFLWPESKSDYQECSRQEPDISIGIYKRPEYQRTLSLIPKAVTVGIGCRKGTSADQIESAVNKVLLREGIWKESILKAASIDLKAEEPGILEYCRRQKIEFSVYSADELRRVEGHFSESDFVKRTTGIGNVCERSAVCAGDSGNQGQLIVRKQAEDGVTVALAAREWRVYFE